MWGEHYYVIDRNEKYFPREKTIKIIFKRKQMHMFWVEYFIENSLIHADCHSRVSTLPNTHVVVQFAIKLNIPQWRIVTIKIDTKYSYLFKVYSRYSVDSYQYKQVYKTSVLKHYYWVLFICLQNMFSVTHFSLFYAAKIS